MGLGRDTQKLYSYLEEDEVPHFTGAKLQLVHFFQIFTGHRTYLGTSHLFAVLEFLDPLHFLGLLSGKLKVIAIIQNFLLLLFDDLSEECEMLWFVRSLFFSQSKNAILYMINIFLSLL